MRFLRSVFRKIKRFFTGKEYHVPKPTPVQENQETQEQHSETQANTNYLSYTERDKKKRTLRYYSVLFATMVISPAKYQEISRVVSLIKSHKSKYLEAQARTNIDWRVIGVIHYMEASCNFDRQLLNGQRWWRRTTIVPKRKGPWKSWLDSTVAAFKYHKLKNSDLSAVLKFLERYNGLGYAKRGLNSPYLWSYSNHYTRGKYVRDGVFDPTAISKQVGAAVILKSLGF